MATRIAALQPSDFDIFSLPVYPDADLLPMLDGEEMEELVSSIQENGLRQPIVIARIPKDKDKSDWMLIDGRNRREACRRAQVEPSYITFEGDIDAIKAFILDSNNRRQSTKSQLAMQVAIILPDHDERGRGKKSILKIDFKRDYLVKARYILANAPDLVKEVLTGVMGIPKAYEDAHTRKKDADSDVAKMEELQKNAPDLANLVKEERLKLDEAFEAWKKRKADLDAQEKNARLGLFEGFACTGGWPEPPGSLPDRRGHADLPHS